MMVVIANELRDVIESSGLKDIEHKSAVGCYEAATFVKNLRKLELDKLLIDITAVRDASNKESWECFKELAEPKNIFILYDAKKSESLVLSNLVNKGFYNFSSSADEILKLIEQPNMFIDVQKYIVSSSPESVAPQKQFVPQQPVKQTPQKMIDQKILDDFKADYKVSYDEVNLIPSQLLCTLLIYVLLVVTTFLESKIILSKVVLNIIGHLPDSIEIFFLYLLMLLFCFVTTIPIISIAKRKTNSVLRFLIVPSLLSLPLLLGILKIIMEFNYSLEIFVYLGGASLLYIPFMGSLLIRGIILNLNSESIDIVKWNIFEKLGMILSIYIFVIPFIRMIFLSLDITIFESIYSILYFENTDSNIVSIAMLIACIVISVLIMASRMVSRKRKEK